MVNMFDMYGVQATADARREGFLKEAENDRIARTLRSRRRRSPGRLSRAVGVQLIRAGARLSGDRAVVVRQTQALT